MQGSSHLGVLHVLDVLAEEVIDLDNVVLQVIIRVLGVVRDSAVGLGLAELVHCKVLAMLTMTRRGLLTSLAEVTEVLEAVKLLARTDSRAAERFTVRCCCHQPSPAT